MEVECARGERGARLLQLPRQVAELVEHLLRRGLPSGGDVVERAGLTPRGDADQRVGDVTHVDEVPGGVEGSDLDGTGGDARHALGELAPQARGEVALILARPR